MSEALKLIVRLLSDNVRLIFSLFKRLLISDLLSLDGRACQVRGLWIGKVMLFLP